jgi:hypothetical protein
VQGGVVGCGIQTKLRPTTNCLAGIEAGRAQRAVLNRSCGDPIFTDRLWKNANLFRHEGDQPFGWLFISRATGGRDNANSKA